nr:hypothetical protein P5658_08280 [Bacillus subtilis]
MADMSFDGIDDLTQYFEKIGGDVEKVEPVALKVPAVKLLLNGSAYHVNRSDKQQPHMQDNITRIQGRREICFCWSE